MPALTRLPSWLLATLGSGFVAWPFNVLLVIAVALVHGPFLESQQILPYFLYSYILTGWLLVALRPKPDVS